MAISMADSFTLQDYTNVTPMEMVSHHVEKMLRRIDRQHDQDCTHSCTCTRVAESIQVTLYDTTFTIRYVEPVHRIHNSKRSCSLCHALFARTHNSLPSKISHHNAAHGITKHTGITQYLVCVADHHITHNEATMLLSTMCIAAQNAEWLSLPLFIQVGEPDEQLFWGRSLLPCVRYDIRSTKSRPHALTYLSDLTDFFHRTIRNFDRRQCNSLSASITLPTTFISVTLTYVKVPPQTNNEILWKDLVQDEKCFFGVPWGPIQDPIDRLSLLCYWNFFKESAFVDNPVYSDLHPDSAPQWDLEMNRREASSSYDDASLAAALHTFLLATSDLSRLRDLAVVTRSTSLDADSLTIFDRFQQGKMNEDASAGFSLDRLSLHDNANNAAAQAVGLLARQINGVVKIAQYGLSPGQDSIQAAIDEVFDSDVLMLIPDSEIKFFSSHDFPAPYGSLLSRFCFAALRLYETNLLTVRSLVELWKTFCASLRLNFERGKNLPHLSSSHVPDHSKCIIHQKLQMLENCIRLSQQRCRVNLQGAKAVGVKREGFLHDTTIVRNNEIANIEAAQNDDSDDFNTINASAANGTGDVQDGWDDIYVTSQTTFDGAGFAADTASDDDVWNSAMNSMNQKTDYTSSSNRRHPSGVASVHDHLVLLRTRQPLNIPLTCDPVVQTSDRVGEENNVLISLESSSEGSRLRAELQSKHLLSDMMAFKAANPGAIIEDFVRWHSPKDWTSSPNVLEGVIDRGRLSKRMRGAHNLWQQLWQSAKPVPVAEQEPLFDEQTEAEHVLHFLENIDPEQLATQLASITVSSCIASLALLPASQISPLLNARLENLWYYVTSTHISEALCQDFKQTEFEIAAATSLLSVLPGHTSCELLDDLLQTGRCSLLSNIHRNHVAMFFPHLNALQSIAQLRFSFLHHPLQNTRSFRQPSKFTRQIISLAWTN